MNAELEGLCSMATKDLLHDLSEAISRAHALQVHFEAAGGVTVVGEIKHGTSADLVVLSERQMADLDVEGLLVTGTLRPLFVSDVVAAVPDDAPAVDLATEADLRSAMLAAPRVAYSTGPSGGALLELLARWGLDDDVRPRLVQAPPGRSVGSLLANGKADLGFQQRSELAGVPGVRVLGPLPGGAAIHSTFSGAVLAGSRSARPAALVLDLFGSAELEDRVCAAGMTTARPQRDT